MKNTSFKFDLRVHHIYIKKEGFNFFMTYSSPILPGDIRHNQLPMSFNAGKKDHLKSIEKKFNYLKKKNLEGTMLAMIF